MSDSLIKKMAKAAYEKFPTIQRGPQFLGMLEWPELQDWQRKEFCDAQRGAVAAARGLPSANLVLKVAGQTRMRASEVDLAVTHWIDAALEEK